jgi:GT2 family glycosyltransferase
MSGPLSRARAALRRRFGGEPVPTDPIVEFADAGFFDLEYYNAQILDPGEQVDTVDAAVAHYTERGRRAGLGVSPYFEVEWWSDDRSFAEATVERLENDFIKGYLRRATTAPLVRDVDVEVDESRDLLVGLLAGRVHAKLPGDLRLDEARTRLIDRVGAGLRAAPNRGSASAVEWDRVRAELPNRVAGRVSVLIPTYEDWRMTTDAVRSVLAHSGDGDIEVVVIDNGSRQAIFRILTSLFMTEPAVRIVRCDTNTNFAGGMNRGIADSSGDRIVLLNNDATVTDGWLPPLLRELESSRQVKGVQPLLLYPNGRVQAAGTMFLGERVLPWHFLADHPREDALRMRNTSFRAVTAAAMMLRADDLAAHEGFDESYTNGYEDVDLCLRMLDSAEAEFRVVLDSVGYHAEGSSLGRSDRDTPNRIRFFERWAGRLPGPEYERYEEVGFTFDSLRTVAFYEGVRIMAANPHLRRIRRAVPAGPAAGRAELRWVLCAGGPYDVDPEVVASARRVLEDLGQEVVTTTGGVHLHDNLDDVLIAFDGSAPFTPRAGVFNVLVSTADLQADQSAASYFDALLVPRGGSSRGTDHVYEYEEDFGSHSAIEAFLALIDAAQAHRIMLFGAGESLL